MTADIEAIERATLASVPPQAVEDLEGWVLAFDPGSVGRAHSAAPLSHGAPALQLLPRIEDRYRAHGFATVLRLPRVPAFAELTALLASRGYAVSRPSLVQVAALDGLIAMPSSAEVGLAPRPHEAWASVFLGEGFDPVDGASRVQLLSRSQDTVYASVMEDGRAVAVGAGCIAHGYLGIHGMRTLAGQRGRGLAGSILATLGRAAAARGVQRAYLQVEADNTGAQSLYARAGFSTAWGYEYWARA